MKLLYISQAVKGTVGYSEDDFLKSLQKNFECLLYSSLDEAIAFKPDVVYVHNGAADIKELQTIKDNTGAVITQWTGDCREEPLEEVVKYKGIADITLLACGAGKQKAMYEQEGIGRVEWFPHGIAEWQFKAVKTDLTNKNVIFIGNNYDHFSGGIERMQIVEALARECSDFEVLGNGFNYLRCNTRSIPFVDSHDLYNNSFISIDGNLYNDKEKYFSSRPLNAMASGCCHIIREVPEMDYGKLLTYNNYMGLKKIIEGLRNNDISMRNQYAQMGQDWVRQNFHYDVLAAKYMEIISK